MRRMIESPNTVVIARYETACECAARSLQPSPTELVVVVVVVKAPIGSPRISLGRLLTRRGSPSILRALTTRSNHTGSPSELNVGAMPAPT
jgi:hypothetical protein